VDSGRITAGLKGGLRFLGGKKKEKVLCGKGHKRTTTAGHTGSGKRKKTCRGWYAGQVVSATAHPKSGEVNSGKKMGREEGIGRTCRGGGHSKKGNGASKSTGGIVNIG